MPKVNESTAFDAPLAAGRCAARCLATRLAACHHSLEKRHWASGRRRWLACHRVRGGRRIRVGSPLAELRVADRDELSADEDTRDEDTQHRERGHGSLYAQTMPK